MGRAAATILVIVVIVVLVLYALKLGRDLSKPSTTSDGGPAPTRVVVSNPPPQTQPTNPPQAQPTTAIQIGGSTRHKYEWMSGDIIGQSGTCEFAISQPDQPLNITAQGQVASGSFYASSDAQYSQQKDALQQAAARGSQSGTCPDY